jgi:arsenate reductase (glutaredoxin)
MTPRPDVKARAVDIVGLPYCTTCQKVQAELESAGVKVRKFRDVKTEPLSEAEVRELARRVGGVERLFSRRALKYRALGLDRRPLSEQEMVEWMVKEYTFVTRPVVLDADGEAAFCGGAPRARANFLHGDASK